MDRRGTKILVIDNDCERARGVLESLDAAGLQAERAGDCAAALAACGTGLYGVALVAERVGASDGLELVRALRHAARSVPAIVLTERAGRDAWQTAFDAGAADCLVRDRADRETLERAIHLAIRQRRTELALDAHEAWYHRLFESLPQPMLAYDVETLALLEANHAAVAQYGYTRDEFLSLKLTDIRPPEDVPRLLEWVRTCKDQPYVDAGCWRHRRKDGTVFEVEIRSNALTWNGRYARVVLARDLTAQRAAEEALRESEARFRGAFDSAAIGMAIVATDGRMIRVNQSLCQFTGYSEAELLASDIQSITHPDDLDKDLAALGSLFRGEIRTYRTEKRYIHKSGHTVWGLLCVSVVNDARGAPLYVIGEVKDITPRKRDEAAIARLLDRLERLRMLDGAIVSAASPRAVAEAALDHLLELIPCCCGRVELIGPTRGHRTVLATRGFATEPQSTAPDDPVAPPATACCESGLPPSDPPCVVSLGVSDQELVCVSKPLTYKGRLLGGLHLYFNEPGAPDREHLEVAREVADLLAIALRQARLFRQVRRGRRRLSALSKRLIAAQEAERRRLARELHDEIGQSLTALKLSIQAGADSEDPATRKALAEEGRWFIDQLIDQVRNLSLNLRPSMLDDFGLVSALRWYVDRLARHSGIVARLAVDPAEIRASAEIETACFRIAQEALTNVARHAKAQHLWVELRGTGHELAMTIRDDGAGFDPAAARERAALGAGLGLLGMRERAALLGGRIEITARPGEGTLVHATIPLARREP